MKSVNTIALIVALLLTIIPASSQCAPQSNSGSFWSQLMNKLEGFAPQKKSAVTTAVGGVRGSKDKSADTLYWKDESSLQEIAEKELNDFRQACLSADEGDSTKARDQFEAFLREYPQSPLRSDAELAISRLSEATAVSAPTATSAPAPDSGEAVTKTALPVETVTPTPATDAATASASAPAVAPQ